jgi:hypothetical protein
MMSSSTQEKSHESLAPSLTTLIIDGGHFDFALESAINNYAHNMQVDPSLIHFDVQLFLKNLEDRLKIKFDRNQMYFYQGTNKGEPNAFHIALRNTHQFHVRIYDMKEQSGRESISHADWLKASKPPPVVEKTFLARLFCCFTTTPVHVTAEPNRIVKIRVERAVDVQIGVKMVECSLGKNGAINNPNMLVISGDGDLEPACVSVSDETNLIVVSQHGSMSKSIKKYLPKTSFNIERSMERCMLRNDASSSSVTVANVTISF